jgi:hypothetical protein
MPASAACSTPDFLGPHPLIKRRLRRKVRFVMNKWVNFMVSYQDKRLSSNPVKSFFNFSINQHG